MKKNIKMLLIAVIIIIVIVIGGLFLLKNFNKNIEPLYVIVYDDNGEPGSQSRIEIYNEKIEITTIQFCNTSLDCESKENKVTYEYSKENMEKLNNFMDNNFSKKEVQLNYNQLTDQQNSVIRGLLISEYLFEIEVEEYKYKLEYTKDDGYSYNIYFKNDESILVKKIELNSDYDIVNLNTYSVEFSKQNMSILNLYIENECINEKTNIIYKSTKLGSDELNILNSIIENDEEYLKNIKK